jgi:hypothetical protein
MFFQLSNSIFNLKVYTVCEILKIPHCLDNGLQMAVKLTALDTDRTLLPRNIIILLLVLISVRG